MSSVLCVYDIAESLKIPNPSAYFRRFGFRVNLSCWVFPQALIPTDHIESLRSQGAAVHVIEFAEKDQDKILDLARAELNRHAKSVIELVGDRSKKLRNILELHSIMFEKQQASEDAQKHADKVYRKYRSVLSRGKRELLATEQCAMGFAITRDVEDALDGLKNLLSAELDLALAWKDKQKEKPQAAPIVAATINVLPMGVSA